MFKRILVLGAAAALGFLACVGAIHYGAVWNLFPNRDLNRASAYVREVLKIVNENYVDPQASSYDELARLSIHGMVDSLDPHSEFLESKDNQELEEDLDGEYGGIGVEVELHKDAFAVVAPIPGSPGFRAGIRAGDEIVSIDGKVVDRNSTMDSIVNRLRGKPQTHVLLGLLRPVTGARLDFNLVREVIKVISVRGTRVLDGFIGYIKIRDFSEHTGEQFDDALEQLLKKGIDSLIIDLRNNPGGLLDSAVEVAEPFFKKGELIVYTQGRKPSDRENFLSETEGDPLKLPMVVLINGDTASAAEIVAGALKDTGRAVIVGERSFGKGSVQSIFKLKNGEGLRLTTAHYFTPSGVKIHGAGIAPQVEVVMTAQEDRRLDTQASRPDLNNPKEFRERFGYNPVEDRQLDAAVDILRVDRMYDK
ncbi:MAG TPA: S41 family peptidase [Opitutaceae bacterium]|jgi:carboxyl-terminal processing protease